MRQTNQFSMYSVDTSDFFTDEELDFYRQLIGNKDKKLKAEFKEMISLHNGKRKLREDALTIKNVISSFESNLSRVMGIKTNSLSLDIITVRVYYYEILDQIIEGFKYIDDEEFVFLTASAGQIRTKTLMFIRKSKYDEIEMTLKAGLTDEMINKERIVNEKKIVGCNYNKYMAYLALNSSSSFEWESFDIDKAIVVEDFETLVEGEVDNIDEDYSIDPKVSKKVQINHTDGCGMYLSTSKDDEALQFRAPWFKGLLVPFNFVGFINDSEINPECRKKVTDIYNKEYNIIEDEIKYIFTKSQFKMWQYYDNWQHYKDEYKKYNCKFATCQWEPGDINKKLGYQYLQTLQVTDDELEYLSKRTKDKIERIGHDRDTTLNVLCGEDGGKNPINKAISLYPEMLNDPYSKQLMRDAKDGLIKQAYYGKLSMTDTKYAFVVPDLYAFCESLILGVKNPNGLLGDGEVSCRLFKNDQKLDCMRAPHLYREHSIQINKRGSGFNKWFTTNCIYTSTKSLISKMLQFDVDGDTLLISGDKKFVDIAKRNMVGIVPLYYEMKKAEPKPLSNVNRLEGLKSAFAKNIGEISNDISIVWSNPEPDLDVVKWLVYENNAIIDYAKTLWMPKRPKDVENQINDALRKEYVDVDKNGNERIKKKNSKVPHFFVYAKDKELKKVEPLGNGTVDRLYDIFKDIPNKHETIGKVVGKMDYKKLMSSTKQEIIEDIVNTYIRFAAKQWKLRNDLKGNKRNSNINFIVHMLKEELHKINPDDNVIVDVLVKYLYLNKKLSKKKLLWDAYGDIIVKNLERNMKNKALDNGWKLCKLCNKRKKLTGKQETCQECKKQQNKERKIRYLERTKNDKKTL